MVFRCSKRIEINKLIPLQEAQELIEEQLITMAMEKYNSLKLAANVLGISPPTMTRKYKKIKEMKEEAQMLFSMRHILESELDKRLRATAVVTSVSIPPAMLEMAIEHPNNTKYLDPVSEQLTQIYTREEGVQWGFIFVRDEEGNTSPASPFAIIATVSLVLVSASTLTMLNDLLTASLKMVCNTSEGISASVTK